MSDGDRMYPCPVCGGIGSLGQNLTVPCRTCGGHGEVYDAPRPIRGGAELPPPLVDDPWAVPTSEPTPPPF